MFSIKLKNNGIVNNMKNKPATVQTKPGSNGVGPTKSPKLEVQTKPGGRVGGTNSPAKVEPCH
jgi:hypothetical protein